MLDFVLGIASAVMVGMLGWLWLRGREAADRRRVFASLRSNTRDDPGESHVDTVTIAKGTGLPEDRVRRACMADGRVLRPPGDVDSWSVWRAEPQSIYERRGLLEV